MRHPRRRRKRRSGAARQGDSAHVGRAAFGLLEVEESNNVDNEDSDEGQGRLNQDTTNRQ